MSFRELLGSVHDTTAAAYANQDVPFEEVVRHAIPDRELSRALSSRVVFGMRRAQLGQFDVPGLAVEIMHPARGTAKFDLELQTVWKANRIEGFLDYNRELFEPATISGIIAAYEALLARVVADPAAPVEKLAQSIPSRENKPMQATTQRPARKSLRDVRPQKLSAAPETMIRDSPLIAGNSLPLLVEPSARGVDLAAWLATAQAWVQQTLLRHGALLFRNFEVVSIQAFEEVVKALTPDLMHYTERSTPRSLVSGNIYTSTEYPADRSIRMHNENSYSNTWPRKLWFYCAQPATSGGATPIADSRLVYQRIDPTVRARFEQRGVLYLRNYRDSLGMSWQEGFQTNDPAAVEAYCSHAGMTFEWITPAHLRTRHIRPATATHPISGERVWFNQANLFHVASLGAEVRASMSRLFTEEEFPRAAYYGDHSPIPDADVAAIESAYAASNLPIQWQSGDVLLVDNMLVAHGREAYEGPRKIVVALAEPSALSNAN